MSKQNSKSSLDLVRLNNILVSKQKQDSLLITNETVNDKQKEILNIISNAYQMKNFYLLNL